jgi:hypothetical protein
VFTGCAVYAAARLPPLYRTTDAYGAAGAAVAAVTPPDAVVVSVHDGSPEVLYYAHRRGWRIWPPELSRNRLEILRAQGATHAAIVNRDALAGTDRLVEVAGAFRVVAAEDAFLVLDLRAPPAARGAPARLDLPGGGALLSWDSSPAGAGDLVVHLVWRAGASAPGDFRVSLRLLDGAGGVVAQADGPPLDGYLPGGAWIPGDTYADPHRLHLPAGLPPGAYNLTLSPYRPEGPPIGPTVTLGTVTLGPSFGAAPAVARPLRAVLGDDYELVGYDPPSDPAAPGGTATYALLWRARRDAPPPLTVRIALGDQAVTGTVVGTALAAGQILRQRLSAPVGRVAGPTELVPVLRVATEGGPGSLRTGPFPWQAVESLALEPLAVARPGRTPPPAGAARVAPQPGWPIALEAYQVARGDGRSLEVTLYWRAEQEVPLNYAVFVHLAGPDGRPLAQTDGPPCAGGCPTRGWRAGDELADTHHLAPPADLPPGRYRLLAGLYDTASGRRLAGPNGPDFVELGEIDLGP